MLEREKFQRWDDRPNCCTMLKCLGPYLPVEKHRLFQEASQPLMLCGFCLAFNALWHDAVDPTEIQHPTFGFLWDPQHRARKNALPQSVMAEVATMWPMLLLLILLASLSWLKTGKQCAGPSGPDRQMPVQGSHGPASSS